MASCIREVVEALIKKLQADVTPNTVLVPINDYYEIKHTPSLLVIGPKLEENRSKRNSEKRVEVDRDNLSYTERNWPRYYHLDFDFVLTADTGAALLDLQEKGIAFFLDNREITTADASFRLVELTPIGGLERPNYSNLRQASGRYRIEDVEVFDHDVVEGKIVLYRNFRLCDFGSRRLIETYRPDE
ncbi:MAG: hypothetical protein BWY28_02477 [bacterium ADurb.Bin236]|nr:MAG: hypothetical protein BWY28_02477 [bacterium ADurb.Bin236]